MTKKQMQEVFDDHVRYLTCREVRAAATQHFNEHVKPGLDEKLKTLGHYPIEKIVDAVNRTLGKPPKG